MTRSCFEESSNFLPKFQSQWINRASPVIINNKTTHNVFALRLSKHFFHLLFLPDHVFCNVSRQDTVVNIILLRILKSVSSIYTSGLVFGIIFTFTWRHYYFEQIKPLVLVLHWFCELHQGAVNLIKDSRTQEVFTPSDAKCFTSWKVFFVFSDLGY